MININLMSSTYQRDSKNEVTKFILTLTYSIGHVGATINV